MNENTPDKEAGGGQPTPPIADDLVTTRHTVTVDGQTIAYTATAGTLVLKEEAEKSGEDEGKAEGEKARASIFFIAYTREDVDDLAARPITFAFNGGPGSSSIWLHLGALGPKRVQMDDDGMPTPPPYRLVENEATLLDVSDLVFIDPVSTGFSRPVPGEKAKDFHGFTKDIESVGEFIRLYTTRYGRWRSPKFLAGESYGTTRAAGLAGHLQERYGLYLNGIILLSTVLDFQTIRFDLGNDLAHVLYLPAYAATAWYHGRLAEDLQALALPDLLRQVEAFALGEYALALLQGDMLPAPRRREVAAGVARFIGLPQDYVERCNLRIAIMRFAKELLRDQRRTVGRIDSRYIGIDRDAAGETFEHDPSMSAVNGPYSATFNDYVRGDLQFESDIPYEFLNPRVWPAWRYDDHENRYVYVAETLRKAMSVNPYLKVHAASGIFDLATPYFATDYTLSHLGLDESLRGNVSVSTYEAGHMMYVHRPSHRKLKRELATFVQEAGNLTAGRA